MPPTVSIIVVNYNGEGFLRDCLNSIWQQTRQPDQVMVVDNASRDRSLEILREESRRLTILPLQENLGYARAFNIGISRSAGDLVAVLNNDVVLDPDWLATLLRHHNGEWDFWASQILFASSPDLVDSAGDGMAVVGSAFKMGHGEAAREHNQLREVFGPCGAAALYTRRLLEATNGMDNDFFLVYEDADLNMRARLLGYKCLYVPQAKVFHRVNTSIGTLSFEYVYYGHRNSEFVFWKNMPGLLLLLYLPERTLFNIFSLLYFLGKGQGTAFFKAKRDAMTSWPRLLKQRREIRKSRRISVSEFRRLLERNWLKGRKPFTGIR